MTGTTGGRRPTLAAVAAAAGVSRTTASRVLNHDPTVHETLRRRVRAAIAELDYRPDEVARSLRRQRTGLVGLVVPDEPESTFADQYLGSLVRAATRACDAAGRTLALLLVATDEQQQRTAHHLRREGLLDGVVLVATHDAPARRLLERASVPTVVVGDPGVDEVPSVDVDNVAGGRMAADHLLRCGRRRIALVSGPDDNAAARGRHHGATAALADAGMTPVLELVGEFTAASGRAAADAVVSSGADAVAAGSDAIAAGLLHGLADAGRHVPDDVAVVGFDDLSAAAHTTPPLTTVRQPIEEVASLAVARLGARIEHGRERTADEPARMVLDVELVVRASTPPPRRS